MADIIGEKLDQHRYDPVSMIEALGGSIRLSNTLEDGVAGIVRKVDGGTFEMEIPRQETGEAAAKSTRFLLSHLLGHLFIHMGFLLDDEQWSKAKQYRDGIMHVVSYQQGEREANLFAQALLMPEEIFMKVLCRCRCEKMEDQLTKMSDQLFVPVERVIEHGKWLGVFEVR